MNPDIASIPLRDIHLPESVSWWPLAPGWWITLGLLVLAASVVYFLKFIRQRKQFEQQTLDEFDALVNQFKNDRDANALLANVSQLLRRVAITCFGHNEVAALTGDSWLTFLDRVLANAKNYKGLRFEGELGQLLVNGQYRKPHAIDENRLDQLLIVSKNWLLLASRKKNKSQQQSIADSEPDQALQLASLRGER